MLRGEAADCSKSGRLAKLCHNLLRCVTLNTKSPDPPFRWSMTWSTYLTDQAEQGTDNRLYFLPPFSRLQLPQIPSDIALSQTLQKQPMTGLCHQVFDPGKFSGLSFKRDPGFLPSSPASLHYGRYHTVHIRRFHQHLSYRSPAHDGL